MRHITETQLKTIINQQQKPTRSKSTNNIFQFSKMPHSQENGKEDTELEEEDLNFYEEDAVFQCDQPECKKSGVLYTSKTMNAHVFKVHCSIKCDECKQSGFQTMEQLSKHYEDRHLDNVYHAREAKKSLKIECTAGTLNMLFD